MESQNKNCVQRCDVLVLFTVEEIPIIFLGEMELYKVFKRLVLNKRIKPCASKTE